MKISINSSYFLYTVFTSKNCSFQKSRGGFLKIHPWIFVKPKIHPWIFGKYKNPPLDFQKSTPGFSMVSKKSRGGFLQSKNKNPPLDFEIQGWIFEKFKNPGVDFQNSRGGFSKFQGWIFKNPGVDFRNPGVDFLYFSKIQGWIFNDTKIQGWNFEKYKIQGWIFDKYKKSTFGFLKIHPWISENPPLDFWKSSPGFLKRFHKNPPLDFSFSKIQGWISVEAHKFKTFVKRFSQNIKIHSWIFDMDKNPPLDFWKLQFLLVKTVFSEEKVFTSPHLYKNISKKQKRPL